MRRSTILRILGLCLVLSVQAVAATACDLNINVSIPPDGDQADRPVQTTVAESEPPISPPADLDLPFDLPDFALMTAYDFGWGAYRYYYEPDTPYESVQNYVGSLGKEGFTCYHTEDTRYSRHAYLLYRDNTTILIEKTEYSCSLRYHISTPPQENDGTPNPFPSPSSEEVLAQLNHEKAIYAFEVTPRELYNATGARLYEVVYQDSARWMSYSIFDSLRTDLVLVGEDGVLPMHCLSPGEMHFHDTDGNGITELLYISGGYTSGIPSEIINILEMQDGVPTEKAIEMVSMQSYAFVTDADGNLLLRRTATWIDLLPAPADYRFTVKDGNIIFHPIGETAPIE